MTQNKKKYLFDLIRKDCINMIDEKNINIEDLAFDLGISEKEFYKIFNEKCEDFTIFLKTYSLLIER